MGVHVKPTKTVIAMRPVTKTITVNEAVETTEKLPIFDLKSNTDYERMDFFCSKDSTIYSCDKYKRGYYFEARLCNPVVNGCIQEYGKEVGLTAYLTREELTQIRDEINKALRTK